MLALLVAVQALAAVPGATSVTAVTLPAGFTQQTVLEGLTNPTIVQFAPDGRVFVGEKSGLIKVFSSLDDDTPSVFADLRTNVHNFWDRGFLGMVLAPNFATNPSVYVAYAYDHILGDPAPAPRWGTAGATADGCPTPPGATADGCVTSARVSVLTDNGGVAGPERVLVEDWCQQYPSHTVGSLLFGPDGMLYASAGDGASFNWSDYGQDGSPLNPCGDPPTGVGGTQTAPTAEGGALRSQDLRTMSDPVGLDGSIIRINPTTGAAAAGNPLGASPDANARRIITHGFRNPFRMTFRPGTSELWIGDVGSSRFEEINRIVDVGGSVENAGWPCYEGTGRNPSFDSLDLNICEGLYASGSGAHQQPYFTYGRHQSVVPDDGCAIGTSSLSGLAFYPEDGPYGPAFAGSLFFSDYARDCIWVMRRGANGLPDPATREVVVGAALNPVYLTIGPDKQLYYVDYTGGAVHRLHYVSPNDPPTAGLTATPQSGPVPLDVSFSAAGSTDPDNDPLTYEWDLDGDGAYDDATGVTASRQYDTVGQVTVRVRVRDPAGGTDTASVVVTAGGSAPLPEILTPATSARWAVDDVISFTGRATDPQDGDLAPSRLAWDLIVEHCPSACHSHIYRSWEGTAGGSFVAPDHEYPSHLVLRLTATDSSGQSAATQIALQPRTVSLRFETSPSGLPLTVGDTTSIAPFTRTVIVGSRTSVSAVAGDVQGEPYVFSSWSDGGSLSHEVVAPSVAATYRATYRAAQADSTPPKVTAPLASLRGASVVSSAPIQVKWGVTETQTGIAATELHRRVNGGAWQPVALPSANAISVNTSIAVSGDAQFRARARDGAGNWSAWQYGPVLRGAAYQESYRWLRWSGSWALKAGADWYGGAARTTTAAGSVVQFTFTGRSVAWVARTGPSLGIAEIHVDGVRIGTISLYAASPGYRSVRYSKTWTSAGTHTLQIRNLATSGHPGSEVDAFLVLH